ncbi:MAG: hypothetical protein CL530_00550 [Aequorivita sp.]|nr:hypothetical protein [Aequorivita sp.]
MGLNTIQNLIDAELKEKQKNMSTFSIIVIIVIILHLVVGFGWLIYKLSPRKENMDQKSKEKDKFL